MTLKSTVWFSANDPNEIKPIEYIQTRDFYDSRSVAASTLLTLQSRLFAHILYCSYVSPAIEYLFLRFIGRMSCIQSDWHLTKHISNLKLQVGMNSFDLSWKQSVCNFFFETFPCQKRLLWISKTILYSIL